MDDLQERQELASKVKEAREYRGFSQEEVAKHLGISRSAVSLIENGTRKIEVIELKKIAELYDCTVGELTGETPEAESDDINMVARAAKDLAPEDREEVLRFAQYLKSKRNAGKKK